MKKILTNVSPLAKKILVSGLSVLALYFVYILIAVSAHTSTDTSLLIHIYSPQLEHIIMSLTILILGTLILDITEKELKNNK